MFHLFLMIISFGAANILSGQTVKNLDNNNGFKNFKLGSSYTSLYGIKSKDESGADKVVVRSSQEKIGDIPVQLIELYYLDDILAKINVRVSAENYSRLLEACRGTFGSSPENLSDNKFTQEQSGLTSTGNNYTDRFLWKGKNISLEYFYTYPKVSGGANQVRNLHLTYFLNNYSARLQKAQKNKYSAGDF